VNHDSRIDENETPSMRDAQSEQRDIKLDKLTIKK
jgi:hypothetical protein